MADTWPLILDGVECGTVTAQRSGAYTVFTARALYSGPLRRISLYGGGAEGSLGVFAPDGDEVTLTFSANDAEGTLVPLTKLEITSRAPLDQPEPTPEPTVPAGGGTDEAPDAETEQ